MRDAHVLLLRASTLAALGLALIACGGDDGGEASPTAETTEVAETEAAETEVEAEGAGGADAPVASMPEPPSRPTFDPGSADGCGDGDVDEGEVCDDGGANCPDGWGLCMRCRFCTGWEMAPRTQFLDPLDEEPPYEPPFCSHEHRAGDRVILTVRNEYDDHGLLTSRESSADGTSTFTYDERGRQTVEARTFEGEPAFSIYSRYLEHGRVAWGRDQGSDRSIEEERRYVLDERGLVVRLDWERTADEEFLYDGLGRFLERRPVGSGARTLWLERDDNGHITFRRERRSLGQTYRYDAEGRLQVRVQETTPRRPPRGRTNWYYDDDGHLERREEWRTPDELEHRCTVTTDEAGRPTREECDEDDDGEADFVRTWDYACLADLELPRAGAAAEAEAEDEDE